MRQDWIEFDVRDRLAVEAVIHDIELLIGQHPDAMMDHDLSWLVDTHSGDGRHPVIYLYYENARLIGYTPFLVQPGSVPFSLGEIILGGYTVQQFTLVRGPIIEPGIDEVDSQKLILKLFRKLSDRLRSRQLIFVLAAPCRSLFSTMLKENSEMRKLFHIFPYGSSYERRLIQLPETFEAYMKQLGPKTRPDLQRHHRRLKEHVGGQLQVRIYKAANLLSEFLELAEAISRKTYQWHLLGLGLREHERFETQLSAAAKRGCARCYILTCNGHPVAFMVGYIHKERYYSTDIGYDPNWAKWSVGNVLHSEVIRDLIGNKVAKFFDFMGDNPNKERLSNIASEEANFYLFPRTVEGSCLKYSLRAVESISMSAAQLLEALRLKSQIRKFIRQRATAGQTKD